MLSLVFHIDVIAMMQCSECSVSFTGFLSRFRDFCVGNSSYLPSLTSMLTDVWRHECEVRSTTCLRAKLSRVVVHYHAIAVPSRDRARTPARAESRLPPALCTSLSTCTPLPWLPFWASSTTVTGSPAMRELALQSLPKQTSSTRRRSIAPMKSNRRKMSIKWARLKACGSHKRRP